MVFKSNKINIFKIKYNTMKKYLLLLLILTSCASRKTNAEKVKEEVKIEMSEVVTEKETTETKTDVNIKVDTKTKVDTEKNVVTETKTIKPIDATKKSNYKGIEFENAEINETKTTDLSKEKFVSLKDYELLMKDTEKAIKIAERLNKENIQLKTEIKNKETEKTYSWWNLLWFLLIIPIYYFYRKYFVGSFF